MNQKIQLFLDNLIMPDYLLFGGCLALFVLFIALAIILRAKFKAALLMVFLAFSILIVGPTYGYIKLHEYLFSHTTAINEVKELEFTNALIVWGDLNNTSNRHFSSCKITADVYKVSGNALFDTIYPLNPFKKSTILVSNIGVNQSVPFKIIVEPFTYSQDYNVSVGASCQ